MGFSFSQSYTDIVNTSVTNMMTAYKNTIENNFTTMARSTQKITLKNALFKNCTVTIANVSEIIVDVFSTFDADIFAEVNQSALTELQTELESAIDQSASGILSLNANLSDVKTEVRNHIENNLVVDITNECSNFTSNTVENEQILTIDGYSAECSSDGQLQSFTNQSLLSLIAKNTSQTSFENLVKQDTVAEFATEVETAVTQTNTGLFGTSIETTIAIVGAVVVLIIIIIVVASSQPPGDSETSNRSRGLRRFRGPGRR